MSCSLNLKRDKVALITAIMTSAKRELFLSLLVCRNIRGHVRLMFQPATEKEGFREACRKLKPKQIPKFGKVPGKMRWRKTY